MASTNPSSINTHTYSKCAHVDDAISIFFFFSYSSEDCSVFAYNAMIVELVANDNHLKCLSSKGKWKIWVCLSYNYTFPCIIRACCDLLEGLVVRKVHGLLFKLSLDFDVFIGSAMVNTFLKFRLVDEAQELFVELPERDVVLWNVLVSYLAELPWWIVYL